MYQKHKALQVTEDINHENDFNNLSNIFFESINLKPEAIEKNITEWDLTKSYKPNHACIWNKIDNIGKECIIIQKNDSIALVAFDMVLDITLSNIYRLEDLSQLNN
jgi:hypothetical protein